MAIIGGKSTYRGAARPLKEGESTTPSGAPVAAPVKKPVNQFAADVLPNGQITSFDPDKRGGGGRAAAAGAPKTALEAQDLATATDMINAGAEAEMAEANKPPVADVPVPEPVEAPEIGTPEPVVPEPLTIEERRKAINDELATQSEMVRGEAISNTAMQGDIAILQNQAKKDLAELAAEERMEEAAKAKYGEQYSADKQRAKIESVRDIAESQGVDLNVAEAMYEKQVTAKSKLEPEDKAIYDNIISMYDSEEFVPEDAYSVAIAAYEKDGIDADDTDKAFNAVASRFGKNFAKKLQDDYTINELGIDEAVVTGNRELANLNEIGNSIASGQGGRKETDEYLSSIEAQSPFKVQSAIDKILDSPDSTDEARAQAYAYGADFYGAELSTDKKKNEDDYLTVAEYRGGAGTLEQRRDFESGSRALADLEREAEIAGDTTIPLADPLEELKVQNLAVKIFGQRAGSKPENRTQIRALAKAGLTFDDIEDRLRFSGKSDKFKEYRSTFNYVTSKGFTSGDRAIAREALDDILDMDDSVQTLDFIEKLARDSASVAARDALEGKSETMTALNDIESLLGEYEDKGGDTNMLTGTLEKWGENILGVTGDPELARIANEIKATIQSHRKMVSGAAFSESEAKEYQELFPDISSSSELNQAKIDSLRNVFQRSMDNFYGRRIGKENYKKLKDDAALAGQEGGGGDGNTGSEDTTETMDADMYDYISSQIEDGKDPLAGLPQSTIDAYNNYEVDAGGDPLLSAEMKATRALIEESEGFRANAYLDQAGVPTIGYGFTSIDGKPVKMGDTITEEDADKQYEKQIKTYQSWKDVVTRKLTPEQSAALTSLTYNVGQNEWKSDNGQYLAQQINEGNFDVVAKVIRMYDKVTSPKTGKKEISKGLVNRRDKEAKQFE